MSSYYRHRCGHFSLRDMWKNAPDEDVTTQCLACRESRIGEVIEFVRFGKPPAGGKSRNYRDAESEAGVSVYEVINGHPAFVGWHFDFLSRPQYRGTGRIVGWGSDGEPVVAILTIKRVRA